MASSLSFRSEQITVHVGHDGTKYVSTDETGTALQDVERIGGPFTTAIQWTIWNRTKSPIRIRLQRFRFGSAEVCPVVGLLNCEHESLAPVEAGEPDVINAAIIETGENGMYDYDIHVSDWETGEGNVIDPELQIDM